MKHHYFKKTIAISALLFSISGLALADDLTIIHMNDHHSHLQADGGMDLVPAGDFSIGDAYKLLPFANTLVSLDMTGAEIHQVLEEALDYALSEGGSSGAYPYAAGLRWDIDASKAMGQISNSKGQMIIHGRH